MTTENKSATDARTPPVAVWQLLEKLKGQDLIDWRVAPLEDRASIAERGMISASPLAGMPWNRSISSKPAK
jgi:3-ketosteroid 9alpha-monooxygenase subunit A